MFSQVNQAFGFFIFSLQDFVLSLLISLCRICGQSYTAICLSLPGTSGDVAETQEKDLLLGSTDEVGGDVPSSYGLPTIWLSPHMCIVFISF